MERQIIFRGKRKDNNEWVYGDLIHYSENDYRILPQNERNWDILESGYEVIPETVGQYTGLRNKNKVKIFEGDILNIKEYENLSWGKECSELFTVEEVKGELEEDITAKIYWKEGGFNFDQSDNNQYSLFVLYGDMRFRHPIFEFEIIGNTTDNPELINNKQN